MWDRHACCLGRLPKPFHSQMPSGHGEKRAPYGTLFLLVESKGEPFPEKKDGRKGQHWATSRRGGQDPPRGCGARGAPPRGPLACTRSCPADCTSCDLWPWAFQNPNRLAPSERDRFNPTTKIGSLKWVVNSPIPKWDPIGFEPWPCGSEVQLPCSTGMPEAASDVTTRLSSFSLQASYPKQLQSL